MAHDRRWTVLLRRDAGSIELKRRLAALPLRPERLALLREIDRLEKFGPEPFSRELVGALGVGHELLRRRVPRTGHEVLLVHDLAGAQLHLIDFVPVGSVSRAAFVALARACLGLPSAVFEPYGDL